MSTKTKCIIIEEGLQTSKLPSELEGLVDKRYPYKLGDLNNDDPVTIIELLVPPQDVPSIALHISTKLLPERYYAHFVNQNELVRVLPR